MEKNRTVSEKIKESKALKTVAERLELSPDELYTTIKNTVAPDLSTRSEFLTFVTIANSYKLNPMRNEISAFRPKSGGVKVVVPIDGWISIVNKQKNFDGVELIENHSQQTNRSGTKLDSVTAKFYLKDKNHPIVITEYMEECYRGTDKFTPWKKWPRRMLRHKAYIQGARIAFGLSGIYDEDEAERIKEGVKGAMDAHAEQVRMPQERSETPEATPTTPNPEKGAKNGNKPVSKPEEKKTEVNLGEEKHTIIDPSEGEPQPADVKEAIDVAFPGEKSKDNTLQNLKEEIARLAPEVPHVLESFNITSTQQIDNPTLARVILKTIKEEINQEADSENNPE